MPVIQVEHLHKRYGGTVAVDDVSLEVHRGEIFGVLGRNGAGKTTTVEIVGGLREADSGTVRVLGLDPVRDRGRLREVVGLQLQESQLQPKLGVREALDLYASFYPDPADPAQLLDELGLTDRADARFDQLSGGQKQRLSVALALVGNPQVAILDELTTGLDPHARRDTWEVVERIRDRGVTIVLVTHLMEEAERLCDRIALIDAGRVVATGTPAELVARATAEQVLRFRPSAPVPVGLLETDRHRHARRRRHDRGPRPGQRRAGRARRAGPARHPPREPAPRAELAGGRLRRTHQPPMGGLTMSSTSPPGPHPPHRRRVPAVPAGAVRRVLRGPVPRRPAHRARPGDALGGPAVRRHRPGPVAGQRHHRLRADRPGARGRDGRAVHLPDDHRQLPRPRRAQAAVHHPGAAVAPPGRPGAGEPRRAAGRGGAHVRARRRRGRRGRARRPAGPARSRSC